jgi:hypothetical protein
MEPTGCHSSYWIVEISHCDKQGGKMQLFEREWVNG